MVQKKDIKISENHGRSHNYRVSGLKSNAIETILEQRERKVVGNNGNPTGYDDDKKISKEMHN